MPESSAHLFNMGPGSGEVQHDALAVQGLGLAEPCGLEDVATGDGA